MARIRHTSRIVERSLEFDLNGRTVMVHTRLGPARIWFDREESKDPRWLVTEADEPGRILAIRITLEP
jgi:hypothetical protein